MANTAEQRPGQERDGFWSTSAANVGEAYLTTKLHEVRVSDHAPIAIPFEPHSIVTFNVNGASAGGPGHKDPLTASSTPELDAAFKEVRQIPVEELTANMIGSFTPQQVYTANTFFGPTPQEWDPKTRFVSTVLQYPNNTVTALLDLADRLESGMPAVDAAKRVAAKLSYGEHTAWASHHKIPNAALSGAPLERNDYRQQMCNVAAYLMYMAAVQQMCPRDFRAALESAREPPTQAEIVQFVDTLLGEHTVVCLQEVPDTMRPALQEAAEQKGYVMVAPTECGKPAVVTLVKSSTPSTPFYLATHRAVIVRLEDALVMNYHADIVGKDDASGIALGSLASDLGIEKILVAGDLQIGKHPGKRSGVKDAFDTAIDREGKMSKQLETRMGYAESWFCPQNKNVPR